MILQNAGCNDEDRGFTLYIEFRCN